MCFTELTYAALTTAYIDIIILNFYKLQMN